MSAGEQQALRRRCLVAAIGLRDFFLTDRMDQPGQATRWGTDAAWWLERLGGLGAAW